MKEGGVVREGGVGNGGGRGKRRGVEGGGVGGGVPSMLRCMSCWSFSKSAWDSATTGSKKGSTAFSCEYANTALTCWQCKQVNNVWQKVGCKDDHGQDRPCTLVVARYKQQPSHH